ncbi:MAG TPA: hypothetical protein EYG19_09905 [Verrucomicrobia bacterium]|nr:hypothetical protein [Verrucomicrobiota bacterium]
MEFLPAARNRFASPLMLLLRVHCAQAARRFKEASQRSGFLSVLIVGFLLFYPLLAAGMFYGGLRYVSKFPGLGDLLIERLIFLLFAFLFMLLLFSNVVVGYTNMFKNEESRFLNTLPIPAQSIFRWKLIETAVVASWAFIVLVAPLLLAFGIHQHADWYFYVLTPPLVVVFIMLPSVFGCWIAVAMARFLDRSLFQATAVLLLLAMCYAVKVYLQPEAASEQTLETRVVDLTDRLLAKTEIAQFPFLPSYWLSSTLTHWVEGARAAAGFFAAVLMSNVLFFGFLGFTQTGRHFYASISSTLSRGSLASDWSTAMRHAPRLCAQVILLAWFLPVVDFAPLQKYWHGEFAPLTAHYAAQRKSEDIDTQSLGRWLTNHVAALEPRLARGALYHLQPEIRNLYLRSSSGEMRQLGPDLDHLLQSNLRPSLSGLDFARGRTLLRGAAANFAAEPEATLLVPLPQSRVMLLHTLGAPRLEVRTLTFPAQAGADDPLPEQTHRLFLRRQVALVDAEYEATAKKVWITDHANYFEGTLAREGDTLQLTLPGETPDEETGIHGFDLLQMWRTNSTETLDWKHWQLGRLETPVAALPPPPAQAAVLPPLMLLAIPLLALLAWVFNSRTAHLLAATAVIGLFIAFMAGSEHWLARLDGTGGGSAFGISGWRFLGVGAWLMLAAALLQAITTIWQSPLAARFEKWFERWQEKRNVFKYEPGLAERIFKKIPGLPSDVLAVLLKDIRMFWRDTAQWGQSLILFGILGVYILNLRFFTEQFTTLFTGGRFGGDYFFKLVSFMNLAACALNLATLTTRFVYPQFSLEGKRLWIVGLSPLGLSRVVKVKFMLASVISLLISLPLIWFSCSMLRLPLGQVVFFMAAISIMSVALNGLAVGMGVMYPNLKEDNPSKIVAGFGGTFCLVLSFVYIGLAVMLLGAGSPFGSPWQVFGRHPMEIRMIYLGMFLVFSTIVGLGPLSYALTRVKKFEH